MKVVGLTGGIGSGKSTVAEIFKNLGVPVYIADHEARILMNSDKDIIKKIKQLFGAEAFENENLNSAFIASKVFKDPKLLEQLNSIVHPAVATHFNQWKQQQQGPYVIKEAAILFENGGYKKCDKTILVTAPKEIRVQRVLQRDKTNRESIEARMQNQWEDSVKIKLANEIIINEDSLLQTKLQVDRIHNKFLKDFAKC